ncbi:MAG TPA: hypothetical protein VFN41_12645 [Candidatus Limnocylindrales bacterium]|nr:hypothetical protein [Candidatus Limnocylindrales bacterium]
MAASSAGTADAADRVAATLERARHVELGRVVVGRAPADVVTARRRALAAADQAGRSQLVRDARQAAAAFVDRAFARQAFSGTWMLTEMAASVARPADRAAVAEALADALTADAVADLIDSDTGDILRATWGELDASSAIPDPSSVSNFTASFVRPDRSRTFLLISSAALLSLGVLALALGSALGVGFVVAGAFALRNALRR